MPGSLPLPLRQSMHLLCLRAKELSKLSEDNHCEVCRQIAEEFHLWSDPDPESGEVFFPIWLSRVVEGVQRDLLENEFKV